jgi:hypothetical protein
MLKYYEDEKNRWPALCERLPRGAWAEVEAGIRRLALAHGLSLRNVQIKPTSGHRYSRAGRSLIKMNMDVMTWLVCAHEVAHTYAMTNLSPARRGHGWHNRVHARIVDRFAAWIIAQGWHEGALAHELALTEISQAGAARERTAATPPPIEVRIEHRERQVKRLTTRIKTLTTRLKRAQRSLAALRRSKDRGNETKGDSQ